MSAAEISFRSRQKIREGIEGFRWHLQNGYPDRRLFTPPFLKKGRFDKSILSSTQINFFGLQADGDDLRLLYKNHFPDQLKQTIDRANFILQNRFHFLGIDAEYPDEINWNQNPDTKTAYPKSYFKNLNVFNTYIYGDVKYVWELNRHQYLIELGKAYFLSEDEKYVNKIWAFLGDWRADNPYKIGVNWTSALEAAIRIFSWLWAFYLTKVSPIWTKQRKEILIRNLLLHGYIIEENLSYYFSPYNHLIGELAALSFLGTIFSDIPGCENWSDKYWNEMEAQIDRQFYPDGFTVEQASYYHHFTLGFYLMIALLRKQNGLPASGKIWDKLEKALEIVMYMTRPDGHLPMIGDIDNARSIYFYFPRDQWDLRAFLALGAVIFDRGDMKYVSGDVCEELLWLLGPEGIEKYQLLSERKPESVSKAFKHSGYFIMRDDWGDDNNFCCFDCGDIAHGIHKDATPSAAHGHADILSFELAIDGKPLIIDPGFHTYFGDLEWHRYFRSTQAHNTITVNDCGQAQHEGRISWSKVSSPKQLVWFSNRHLDFVGGTIDGFANMEKNTFHRRYILFRKPLYFLIMDEIVGKRDANQTYEVKSFLHFSPGELNYEDYAACRDGEKILHLALPENTEVKVETGGEQPHQGWIAKGYGYRSEAPVMQMKTRSAVPARFGMLFPTKHLKDAVKTFFISDFQDDMIQYTCKAEDWKENIYLNHSQKLLNVVQPHSIETNALSLIIKYDSLGIRELHCIKPSHLMIGDDKIVMDQLSGVSLNFQENKQYSLKEWK